MPIVKRISNRLDKRYAPTYIIEVGNRHSKGHQHNEKHNEKHAKRKASPLGTS